MVKHCDGRIQEIGGVFAFVTGLRISLFNGCIVIGSATSTDLQTAMDWVASRGLPHRVYIDQLIAADLGDVPLGRGFTKVERLYPGMVLHPIPATPPPPPGVSVDTVTPAGMEEFIAVSIEGGMPPDAAHRLYSPTFAADPDVRLFIGRLDGQAVGTSAAIRGGDVSGVYAVGTKASARRRGVGTALSWAAVDAGRDWGCDTIVLDASEMGLPIYEAMGFRTVVRYAEFARPSTTAT